MLKILFWLGLFLVAFTYVGYGLLVTLWLKWRRTEKYPVLPALSDDELPSVTLLIAAYNELDILPEKLDNCRALDYPAGKLNVLFVTDGSNDGSQEWLAGQAGVEVLHQPGRAGKIAAIDRAMRHVHTPFTVFTDANTLLNAQAIRRLMADFADPRVGAVAGEKKVIAQGDAGSSGEGMYWRYESFLKRQDSRLYSVVGAAGELYAIRTHLFQAVPPDTVLDDFMQTLRIAQAGYRVTYAPEAQAEEYASASIAEELKRKVRICAGGFQAMSRLRPLLNPLRHGVLSFQYIGHRVLRWTLAPLFLPIIFISNLLLAQALGGAYTWLMAAQAGFYLWALAGYALRGRKVPVPGFFVPYYFAVMNYSVYAGYIRYSRGAQQVTWEKAQRAQATVAENG